jgi:transposase
VRARFAGLTCYYSKEEELFIIKAKENGMPAKEIAETLNRSYWGIVDKLRRMKNFPKGVRR